LWEAGHEPGYLRLNLGNIESFSVRIGERSVIIKRAIDVALRGEQSAFSSALTKRGQVVFEEELAKLRSCFQPINGLSTYSQDMLEMLHQFGRGPRCGLLQPYKGPAVGFDVSKAYTECMSLITQIPVFSEFDRMLPCEIDCDIKPLSFYHVYVHNLDPILFPQSWDFVPGQTVTFAREKGIEIETHGVVHPHRTLAVNGRKALEEMWRNEELDQVTTKRGEKDEDVRKAIPNMIWGMDNKKYTKQIACLFTDEKEAHAHSPLVMKLGPGFMAVKVGQKRLKEGYMPVGRLILDAMRRKLFRMVAAVGGHAVAIRTDCVYVAPENEAAARADLIRAGFKFGNLQG